MTRRVVVWVMLFGLVGVLGACTLPAPRGAAPLRYRDAVFSTVSVQRDLTYGSAPDTQGNPVSLTLDLYQPSGDTVARRPAVIWVHGGGFCCGSKTAGEIVSLSNEYAKLGYVAVAINYRLLVSTGCGGNPDPTPECVTAAIAAQHDAQAAVRWLRRYADTYRIDPNRVAIGGTSAGAVTSLLVGTRSEDPGDSGNPGYPSDVKGAVSVSGGMPTNDFINRGDAATQFFHGTLDRTVPYSWAVSNWQAMQAAGVPAIFNPFEGAGHGLWAEHRDYITPQSEYFLYYTLDLAHP